MAQWDCLEKLAAHLILESLAVVSSGVSNMSLGCDGLGQKPRLVDLFATFMLNVDLQVDLQISKLLLSIIIIAELCLRRFS